MRVLLFGASGMVGQGVLLECLKADDVEEVVCVVRKPLAQEHAKLAQAVQEDVSDLSGLGAKLGEFDACFFPLGVSAAGMSEAEYTAVTHGLALAVGRQVQAARPGMVFVYVSGAGTDAGSRAMWARVKARTEADLAALLPNAYMFRPGLIQPLDGIRSRTGWYNAVYAVLRPGVWLWSRLRPDAVTTTRTVGQAMLEVARSGFPKRVLEARDIRLAAAGRA